VQLHRDDVLADCASGSRSPLGDDSPFVDDREPLAELVGLLQVLRGEEDRRARRVDAADLIPDRQPEAGSRPVVGSSRKSTLGWWTRALARSSRRFIPPE